MLLKDLIYNDDDQIRGFSASIFGIISQVSVRILGMVLPSSLFQVLHCTFTNAKYFHWCITRNSYGFLFSILWWLTWLAKITSIQISHLFQFIFLGFFYKSIIYSLLLSELHFAVSRRWSNFWSTGGTPYFSIISKLVYKARSSSYHICLA